MGSEEDFGGLSVVLMGDFFQMQVIGDKPMYKTAMTQASGRFLDPRGDVGMPRERGTTMFRCFRLWEMLINERAYLDQAHADMLARMRGVGDGGGGRLSLADLQSLRLLSAGDVRTDPTWALAPVMTTANFERPPLADDMTRAYATVHKVPRLVWHWPFTGPGTEEYTG